MPEFHIHDARAGYVDLVRWVQRTGEHVAPRGIPTREVQRALVVLENPRDALPVGVGRGVSTGIAAVEACQLLAGISTPKLVVDIGPVFANYREDNGEFHGAYGPRTAGQYEVMIERLKADPSTRQAVTTIWDKRHDLAPSKRDYPCTLIHEFCIRRNRLEMTTHMRSNDVMKGVGYDYWQFTRVQLAMAAVLGVEPGAYYHFATSLHLYESDLAAVDKLHYPTGEFTPLPAITGATWAQVEHQARDALIMAAGGVSTREVKSEAVQWNVKAMRDAIARNTDRAVSNA